MVHFGTPDGATAEGIARRAFSDPDSMKALYAESSFGKLNVEGDVFGWFEIPPVVSCDVYAISQSARDAALAAGLVLDNYDHLLYYFPGLPDCWFGGLGEVGTPAFPARQTWYNGWYDTYVLAHEIGHNLGFWHARSYSCGDVPIASTDQCTVYDEYGDSFDPQGRGTTHFNAYHKAAQGWFENCGVVTTSEDGRFDLEPIEIASPGVLALRIPMDPSLCPFWIPSPCYYYLEYRQPLGEFDGGPAYGDSPMHDGILIHAAAELDLSGQSGLQWTALLDTTPPTPEIPYPYFEDARLAVGSTFQDPTGLRISVPEASTAAIQVVIDMPDGGTGSTVCLDGTPFERFRCDDGVQNGTETDVDCGGECAPCPDGDSCKVAADCEHGRCKHHICMPPRPKCDWPPPKFPKPWPRHKRKTGH